MAIDETPLLRATGLSAHSVGPVSLNVCAGQCLALVGPSGSGKSLLLRAIADLVPHTGQCWLGQIAADSVPAPQWRRWVRYVSSEPGWWGPTVADHFRDTASLVSSLTRLRLDPDLLSSPPDRLSTGERQRLAFLRALEGTPKVLLLDEPTSALDGDAVEAVETIVGEHLQRGSAVIMTSHDPAQVERLANDILDLRSVR